MRVLKRTALVFLLLSLIFILVLWGFMQNFPGDSIADAASKRLSSQTGINFEIQDFELGWSELRTSEISISNPNWLIGPEMRLLVFKNVEVPFTSIVTSREAKINGDLHDGEMQISTELISPETLDLSLKDVRIERVPLFALIPYTFVSGSLSMSVLIKNFREFHLNGRFPEGILKGKLNDTRIRISGGSTLLDLNLPELNQTEILFDAELGQVISLNNIQFKGSLEGTVNGKIKLNKNRLNMSTIDLNFLLTPSPDLKIELSRFSKILLPFKCGEKINVNLKGTFNRLNLPSRNKCLP